MRIEVALPGSTIPNTLPLTGKWFLACVRSFVRIEVALADSTKPTASPRACERLLARVR